METDLTGHDVDLRALEDELLAIRCQLGERCAFDALVERWHRPLWRYARRLTGDDESANEATQEVWLRVVRGISRLREAARLRPWLFGIARRVLMDRLRARYATAEHVDLDESLLPALETDDDLEADLDAMQEGLSRLPLIEREALTLFYLRELSIADVADVAGVPVGTVKSRLFRARRLLRRELDASTSKGDRQ